MNDAELIAHFKRNPEEAYGELLRRYSAVILRMIRRFMNDQDEVMEVYTAVCERLRAKDFRALRRFQVTNELTPWLSVVVANACRDRFRKLKAVSVPKSVIGKLDEREQLIFKYYYQRRLGHQEIAETLKGKHNIACNTYDVIDAVGKINELLSINKRWHLLMALNQNAATASLEDLREMGIEATSSDTVEKREEEEFRLETIERLNDALEVLDPEDQLLVLLRFEHGLKASEIADAMSIEDHKYVYTRLRTVTNRLRRALEGA
jgi:DNA-directed RNA polymerase specialized sigma24 family protein